MANVDILDATGKVSGTAELSDAVFGIEPNEPVMHQVVRAQRNAWRQGTHSTRTRSQVRGGGKKPWRQKGTGHARQGTIRAPQWTGGGVVFGPTPRQYDIKVNRKEVKLATLSAFSAKAADQQVYVVKDFEMEAPSTKVAAQALEAWGLTGRTTLVIPDDAIETYLSFRNIKGINIVPAQDVNTYEILDNKNLVITEGALSVIEEVLA